jgi:hypothetical protein
VCLVATDATVYCKQVTVPVMIEKGYILFQVLISDYMLKLYV